MGSKGSGRGAQTAMMEEMLELQKEQSDYFKPEYEHANEQVFGTYEDDVYEQVAVLDADPDSDTYGEQLTNPDGSLMFENGDLISRGELIKDGRIHEFENFEFTNPFANLENPYADIRTDFDNPASGMDSVAAGMTNVAAGAIDPSAGLEDWSAGMTNVAAGAKNMYANMQNQFAGMENAYAGLENQYEGMENAFEDATIDTRAAEFQAQQVAQQQANIMQGLRGAAGSSGVAALAQTMANQGQLQAQQASAGIAQQERQNQMMRMQESSRMQQMQRGEAARLQSQEAQGAMTIQQQERAGAARVDEMRASGAMSAQQQRIAGAQALQGYQAQASGQLQGLQFQGAAEQQRQYLSGAQALQDAQLRAGMQMQNLQFQGDQWADEMNAAQENLVAQGAWAQEIAAAQGDAAVQQAEFGQLSSVLGMEMGQLAGLQGAFTGAQGNQMAGMSSMAQMFGANAAANQSMWSNIGSTAVSIVSKYFMKCMPKGTNIDCVDGKQAVESIKPGDTIIGYNGSPVKVLQKHEYLEDPTRDVFYQVEFKGEGNKTHKVDVCDMHKIKGIRAKDITENVISKKVYGGVEFSYDLLTEDGGYRIDGIPVNSMIEEMAELITELKNK